MFAKNGGGCGKNKEMVESTQWTSWEPWVDYIWNLQNVKAQTWSQKDSCTSLNMYSQPSISMGSTSLDSTNCRSKIFRKKKKFQKILHMSKSCNSRKSCTWLDLFNKTSFRKVTVANLGSKSDRERETSFYITYVGNLKKKVNKNELIYKAETDLQT